LAMAILSAFRPMHATLSYDGDKIVSI